MNFAIDRPALVNAQRTGFHPVPADQYLPPGMAGLSDVHAYPLDGPDLARAKRLAGSGRHKAVLYANDESSSLRRAHVLATNLAAIGIDVEVENSRKTVLYKKEATKGPQFDIAESNWVSDVYFDPFYFLNFLFEGNFDPSVNVAHFDQPAYNNRLRAAAGLTGAARYRGYAGLDADLTTKASPIVVYGNPSRDDLFSARIDCQVPGPYGMDLAALCIHR